MNAITNNSGTSFRLLQEILAIEDLPLRPMYSVRDIAKMFRVSVRTIQNWIASGKLPPRNLPGRAKFLSQDIEDFLFASRKSGC
jgi:transposase